MSEISAEERNRLLAGLAGGLHRRGLADVALILARSLSSVNVIVSQMLLFAQPLVPHTGWRRNLGTYAILLEDETNWQTLIDHLAASDS